ncbi:MAG: hypothetical protein Q7S36_02965 [Candidatus Liptonbacteria bacterium]|nr:hypothetical protein [Candidatus Liptonbacteria bacterium]
MKKLFVILFLAFLILPGFVSATSVLTPYWGPIVSCVGAIQDPANPPLDAKGNALLQCTSFCDMVDTSQNILKMGLTFALYLLAPILFVWGGVLILTAGGSPEKMSSARKLLLSTAVGIVIVLAAFSMVTFFLKTGLGIVYKNPPSPAQAVPVQTDWFDIKCSLPP